MKDVGCTYSKHVDVTCMKNSSRSRPSFRANIFSASHEIRCTVWNVRLNYLVQTTSALVYVLNQMNPFHYLKIHFNLRERDHWGDQDVDGRIILRWIFRKCDVRAWTGPMWLMIGTGGGRL